VSANDENEIALPGEDLENGKPKKKFGAFAQKIKDKRAANIAKITNRIQEVKTKRTEKKMAKEE
jgi:hypothetical protein